MISKHWEAFNEEFKNEKEIYSKIINQHFKKGYIRKIDHTEKNSPKKYCLSHFPAVKPDLTTTEIRIVFDPSAKCDGVSLNDTIHQGRKMQTALRDVLLRSRRNPVALMCDIAEMYLRIEVAPGDRPYLPFLWRVLNQDERPTECEFNRVVFGLNSSPFQAQFVAKTHNEKLRDEFPMGAETVLKSTYKDDSMDSVANDDRE